jgi:hypothetical protein
MNTRSNSPTKFQKPSFSSGSKQICRDVGTFMARVIQGDLSYYNIGRKEKITGSSYNAKSLLCWYHD